MIGATTGFSQGMPATGVLRLTPGRAAVSWPETERRGAEVLQVAVEHPPRVGEVRAIGSLVSEVMAKYGLKREAANQGTVLDSVA
jgi:hypothetical protein